MDWRLLISHAEAIWKVLSKLDENYLNIELMKMLSLYYMGQDNYKDAVPIQREVLRLVQTFVSDDPEIFLAKNDLALLVGEDEKEQLFREALEERIRMQGIDTEETAETQHNLGSHLISKNILEAKDLLKQALATHTKVNGPFHWRTLMAEMSLASVLLRQGLSAAGEEMVRENIEKKRQNLEPAHPDTLAAITMLADILIDKDHFQDAETLQQEIVDDSMKRFGIEDTHTLNAIYNLAQTKFALGKYENATELWKSTRSYWKLRYNMLIMRDIKIDSQSEAMNSMRSPLITVHLGYGSVV
ncbi:MAG: tetratricopeptide repeat protein [Bacteroidales bacterium]|nr:tetratricopeptide repeat protein [Bacteroidales bacterium]